MLSKNLREARVHRGFNQEQLAKAIGVTTATISRHESGVRFPEEESIIAYSKALNVSFNYLFTGSDEMGADMTSIIEPLEKIEDAIGTLIKAQRELRKISGGD